MSVNACTTETHEADKRSPEALAEKYDAHPEPWRFDDGEALALFTCKGCGSTIGVPVQS